MSEPGVQPEADGRLECLECRRWFRQLPPHLARAHDLTGGDYRERHKLPITLSLRAADLRERASEQGRARFESRPDIRQAFADGRAADPQGRTAAGVAGSRRTAGRRGVRDARERGAQGRAAAAQAVLDARASALGYADLRAFLAAAVEGGQTQGWMAGKLGITRVTAGRWLRELGLLDQEHPNTAALLERLNTDPAPDGGGTLADWLRAQREADIPPADVARQLGRSRATVLKWLDRLGLGR